MSDSSKKAIDGYHEGKRGLAVKLKPGEDIPEGAVPVYRNQLAKMKVDTILKKPNSEIWPFKYAQYIVGGSSWLAGAVTAFTLRPKLKLFGGAGRFTTYLLVLAGPTCISGLNHQILIESLVYDQSDCPLCQPIKAGCVNVVSGWFVSCMLSAVTTAHVARTHATYPVPRLNEPFALFRLLSEKTKRYRPLYGLTFAVSFLVPFALMGLNRELLNSISVSGLQYESKTNQNE